ncbi:uncharacterized protein METZ01_LOCUS226933, partial [marine metagenome]
MRKVQEGVGVRAGLHVGAKGWPVERRPTRTLGKAVLDQAASRRPWSSVSQALVTLPNH